jgi:endonuclease YncB( thermonuclease family)
MTGPNDNDDRDGSGLHGPTEADIRRFGEDGYEAGSERGSRLPGFAWRIAASVAFIALALSLLLNVLLPALSRKGSPSEPKRVSATVTSVIDARTIGVDIDGVSRTVRYIGVVPPGSGAPYHDTAIAANEQWALNRVVSLEADETDFDADGRLLRYVWLDDAMLNLSLVAVGLASADGPGENDRYFDAFVNAESNAKAAGLGIWASAGAGAVFVKQGAVPEL